MGSVLQSMHLKQSLNQITVQCVESDESFESN